ncbi:MAG: hypothetical protein HOP09_02630 [Hyphomicrobium sp.]|nr:hypothetical protein [Hyphomicrobium sp.]
MLRRYLIVNGLTTALMYGAVWALVPSPSSVTQALSSTFESYVSENALLGPVVYRMITVGAYIAGQE